MDGNATPRSGRGRLSSGVGRLGAGAGRLVMRPAGDVLEPVAEVAVDRALAGPLPEAIARALVEHRVIERVVREALTSADFEASIDDAIDAEAAERLVKSVLASPRTERLITEALDSALTANLAERLIGSPEFEQLLARTMSSPAVRKAIAEQTTSIGDEMIDSVRRSTFEVDDRIEARVRRVFGKAERTPETTGRYGGVASRGAALALDALLATVLFLIGAAVVVLVGNLAGGIGSNWASRSIAAAGWLLVQVVYFAGGWSSTGRTLGMHLLGLRVTGPDGRTPSLIRSLVRRAGLWLAIALLFLGFLPALADRRRRALQDYLAGTSVIYDDRTLALSADELAG
jgi:uncharacterized RDD family membrane protein YckC